MAGKGLIRLGFRLLGSPVPEVEVDFPEAEEDRGPPPPPPRVSQEAHRMLADSDVWDDTPPAPPPEDWRENGTVDGADKLKS